MISPAQAKERQMIAEGIEKARQINLAENDIDERLAMGERKVSFQSSWQSVIGDVVRLYRDAGWSVFVNHQTRQIEFTEPPKQADCP